MGTILLQYLQYSHCHKDPTLGYPLNAAVAAALPGRYQHPVLNAQAHDKPLKSPLDAAVKKMQAGAKYSTQEAWWCDATTQAMQKHSIDSIDIMVHC
jgi:hypothetical protein